MAFVPGAQGFGAALIAGAVLGGGASIIDQACSGYPINWGQVGKDSLFGMAGGALGYGVGKGIQWAAKTPVGQRVIGSTIDGVNNIPVVRGIAKRLGPNGKPANPEHVNLASLQRTTHILDGDATGGGHRWPGAPGKTPFPRNWSDSQIMHNVSDIATDPNLKFVQQGGKPGATTYKSGNPMRYVTEGVRDGIPIKAIVEPGGEPIISGYPTQWPALESTSFEIALRNEFALATSVAGRDN
ncbi:EndoU domain-containing protein [Propionibacterium australiense]|uniref:EndoU domain-containing protein n=1 Tax=Propionibacterium australiense TaxID=119981 RepID=UPI000F82304F|nr:EndoU domain-containing protein [Propionibacterium australiense]